MRNLNRGNVIKEGLHAFIAALQFLTRLPVNVQLDYNESVFRRSAVYYPAAGAVIGAILAAAGHLLALVLPPAPVAVVLVAIWAGVTGALHLDGLMDTADGLLSHRSRERALEIMKDSRVGAMGVIAGVLLLMLKGSLLLYLLPLKGFWPAVLIAAPVLSRWFAVWAIAGWPYARAESGMGSLVDSVARREAVQATVWAAALCFAALLLYRLPPVQSAVCTFALFCLAGGAGFVLARGMALKLGGLTGDTYGAIIESLECLILLAAAAYAFNGF